MTVLSDARSTRSSSSLSDRLGSGALLAGTVLSSPDPLLAELAGERFDVVWVDLEHSAIDLTDAQTVVIAAQAAGAACLVRLRRADSELLPAVLDSGVDGVVAPRVDDAGEAERLVRNVRYPPMGSRGYAPRRPLGGRVRGGPADELVCLVQLETAAGVAAVDEIVAVPGLGGVVVGTSDLSMDLGVPLDVEAPALVAAVEQVRDAARRRGVPWGVAIPKLPSWLYGSGLAQDGALLMYSSDIGMYAAALDAIRPRLSLERP